MTPSRDQQIRAIYRAALDRPAAERSSFVADLAGGDEELRRTVERMLTEDGATDVGADVSREPANTLELPAGTTLGQYRIEALLGRGGMGIVYRALDTKLNRRVALKFLAVTVADATAKRRFQQEAATASGLNHPHIVTVHDVGEHEGQQYIVSELIDGGTLDDWSTPARRRNWRQCVELITGVADAIAAAHAAGVLHRDIKPGNILIGGNGYAKLADFGLAKLLDRGPAPRTTRASNTRAGVVIGTVAYMSPEQASGQPLDARSDIFSFGIVLYELLAGRPPFEGATELEQLKSIVHATPAPLPADVPELLRMAVDKALEKDPTDRYQTMRDLVADLRRAVRKSSSSQGAAAATSDAQVAVGLVKRHRFTIVGAVAALGVLVAGGWYFALPRNAGTDASPTAAANRAPAFEITRLTTSGNAVMPAISPDGRNVVYAQNRSDRPVSLWVRRTATASNVEIVPEQPGVTLGWPTVTPDGEFVDYLHGPSPGALPSLWRVPLLGGTPRRLVDEVWSPIGWAPDGRRMAFVRVDVPTNRSLLVVADADGGNQRVLISRVVPTVLLSLWIVGRPMARPVWSPDGNTIALFEMAVPDVRVVFVDVATGAETRLATEGSVIPQGLAWLGPASLVLSQPKELGQRLQLIRMSYPDGAVTPFTNDLASYVGVDVDAAGASLVTSQRETSASLWVGDAAGANGRELVPPTPYRGPAIALSWSGDRVLFDATPDDRFAIHAIEATGGTPREFLGGGFNATVSADGGTVVFTRGLSSLWKTDAAGGQAVQLVPADAGSALITPDGRHVVFLGFRNGLQSPWIVPIEGGEPAEIVAAFAGFNSLDVARDSRRLMFVTVGADAAAALVVCDLPACSNRRDLALPPSIRSPFRFTPDGTGVAYVDELGQNLWSFALDGGPPRQLTSFAAGPPGRAIASFAWSGDGTQLAIAYTTTSEDIVMLRGLAP